MRSPSRTATHVSALLAATSLLGLSSAARAGDGALDTSFHQTGKLVLSSTAGSLYPQTVEQQADGKLLVLATLQERPPNPFGSWSDVLLSRLLPNGDVDASFGTAGTDASVAVSTCRK